ncbi:hypothetical protein LTR66_004271, partial [Elasticomyces elasticus]
MKTFSIPFIATVAAIILGASASPIDASSDTLEKRDTCTIKLDFISSWTDNGLHRFRHAPTTTKSGVDLEAVLDNFWPSAFSSEAT